MQQKVNNEFNDKLTEVYKSKNGTKFYGFVDPLGIPAVRGIAAEKAQRFLELNITERSLKELIRQCKVEAGSGDIVRAFSIIQEIEYRVNFICEETSILDLVCIYFMLQDEDPDFPSEAKNREKHKIFEEDPDARSFFLRIGIVLARKLSGKREEDLLGYLEDNQKMSDRIRRYILEESSINSMNTSTS